jgi:hypothetical protein
MMNLFQKEIFWKYVESLLDVFTTTRKRNQVQSLECNNLLFKDVITLFISKFINLHECWEYLKDKYKTTIGFRKRMLLKDL